VWTILRIKASCTSDNHRPPITQLCTSQHLLRERTETDDRSIVLVEGGHGLEWGHHGDRVVIIAGVEVAAITMVRGIIVIGGDFSSRDPVRTPLVPAAGRMV
jgi:hypothetical protein